MGDQVNDKDELKAQDIQDLHQLILDEIEAHKSRDLQQSYFARVGNWIDRKDDHTLAALEKLSAEVQQLEQSGDLLALKAKRLEIVQAVQADRQAVENQDEDIFYNGGFLKATCLFLRGRIGLAGAATIYALDQMNPTDNFKVQMTDLVMGSSKGALMKGAFHFLGAKPVGIAAKGVGLGIASRVLDLSLTRSYYIDAATGDLNLTKGFSNVVCGSLNRSAIAADVITFGAAHGLFGKVNSLTGNLIGKSPFLSTMFTGTTFGVCSGATYEINRQQAAGEDLDVSKIIRRALIQGALDTLAAVPGGIQAHDMSQGLAKHFGVDSPIMKCILKLKMERESLRSLNGFLEVYKGDGKVLVEKEILKGATGKDLDYCRLSSLMRVAEQLGVGSAEMARLPHLEEQGLWKLIDFMKENPESHVALVQRAINAGATARELNPDVLRQQHSCETYFGLDSPVVKRLCELTRQGLYLSKFYSFVSEGQAGRRESVERAINGGATAKQLNDRMQLEMLPDDVADQIVKGVSSGGVTAAKLRDCLQDLQAGPYMYDLVIHRMREGQLLFSPDAEGLMAQAKVLAASNCKQDRTWAPVKNNLKLSGDSNVDRTASILADVADTIMWRFRLEQNLVFLGRDAWPLVPILRSRGYSAQYFLWSRMQYSDSPTQRQWLREVRPNSVVIDTGYSGSILDYIRAIDPTFQGYLISSLGRYPQLVNNFNHAEVVQCIERFPKVTGRCSTYSRRGTAVCRPTHRDCDEAVLLPRQVIAFNVKLFDALGLSHWYARRYSMFLGGSPQERLGLSTPEDVAQHYKEIQRLRHEERR